MITKIISTARHRSTRALFTLGLVALLAPASLHAGPPLICHPYEIGAAQSLPGTTDGSHWLGLDRNYDRKNLVRDTLALLTPEMPILVRMETLRRAALYTTNELKNWKTDGSGYTAEDRALAFGLLEKLRERTNEKGATRTLALFDAGFFAETLRQTSMDPGVDGYPLLAQAAAARPNDPEIQFALALVSAAPKRGPGEPTDHLARARAGAKTNALLAANLATHNPERR